VISFGTSTRVTKDTYVTDILEDGTVIGRMSAIYVRFGGSSRLLESYIVNLDNYDEDSWKDWFVVKCRTRYGKVQKTPALARKEIKEWAALRRGQ